MKSNELEKATQLLSLLKLAEDRVELQFKDIDLTVNDILIEFKNLSIDELKKALRNGGLGKYGRTFKLSTQEVCFWIRQYLELKNKNRLNI